MRSHSDLPLFRITIKTTTIPAHEEILSGAKTAVRTRVKAAA